MILFVIFVKSIKNSPFLFGIKMKNSIFELFNNNFMISLSILKLQSLQFNFYIKQVF